MLGAEFVQTLGKRNVSQQFKASFEEMRGLVIFFSVRLLEVLRLQSGIGW